MGRLGRTSQTNFYSTDNETSELLGFLKENGVLIASGRMSSPQINEIDFSEKHKGHIYLTLSSYIEYIKFKKIDEDLYYIDATVSPVIEFSSPPNRESSIGRGRIYTHFGYDGREGWVDHGEGLRNLHKLVLNYLKREVFTKERENLGYISHGVLELKKAGFKLSQF